MDIDLESKRYNEHMQVCKGILNKMKDLLSFTEIPPDLKLPIEDFNSKTDIEEISKQLLELKNKTSSSQNIQTCTTETESLIKEIKTSSKGLKTESNKSVKQLFKFEGFTKKSEFSIRSSKTTNLSEHLQSEQIIKSIHYESISEVVTTEIEENTNEKSNEEEIILKENEIDETIKENDVEKEEESKEEKNELKPNREWDPDDLPYTASFMSLALTGNELENIELKVNSLCSTEHCSDEEKYNILRSVFFKEKTNTNKIDNICHCFAPINWTKNLNYEKKNRKHRPPNRKHQLGKRSFISLFSKETKPRKTLKLPKFQSEYLNKSFSGFAYENEQKEKEVVEQEVSYISFKDVSCNTSDIKYLPANQVCYNKKKDLFPYEVSKISLPFEDNKESFQRLPRFSFKKFVKDSIQQILSTPEEAAAEKLRREGMMGKLESEQPSLFTIETVPDLSEIKEKLEEIEGESFHTHPTSPLSPLSPFSPFSPFSSFSPIPKSILADPSKILRFKPSCTGEIRICAPDGDGSDDHPVKCKSIVFHLPKDPDDSSTICVRSRKKSVSFTNERIYEDTREDAFAGMYEDFNISEKCNEPAPFVCVNEDCERKKKKLEKLFEQTNFNAPSENEINEQSSFVFLSNIYSEVEQKCCNYEDEKEKSVFMKSNTKYCGIKENKIKTGDKSYKSRQFQYRNIKSENYENEIIEFENNVKKEKQKINENNNANQFFIKEKDENKNECCKYEVVLEPKKDQDKNIFEAKKKVKECCTDTTSICCKKDNKNELMKKIITVQNRNNKIITIENKDSKTIVVENRSRTKTNENSNDNFETTEEKIIKEEEEVIKTEDNEVVPMTNRVSINSARSSIEILTNKNRKISIESADQDNSSESTSSPKKKKNKKRKRSISIASENSSTLSYTCSVHYSKTNYTNAHTKISNETPQSKDKGKTVIIYNKKNSVTTDSKVKTNYMRERNADHEKSKTDTKRRKTFDADDKSKKCADEKCKTCDTGYKIQTGAPVCKGKTGVNDNNKTYANDNKRKIFYDDNKNKTCADDTCKTCDTDFKRETSATICKGKKAADNNRYKIPVGDNSKVTAGDNESNTIYFDNKNKTCDTDYKRETSATVCKGNTDADVNTSNKSKSSARDKKNRIRTRNKSKTIYVDNKNKTCADDKCKTCDTDYKRETNSTICKGKTDIDDNKSKISVGHNKGKTSTSDNTNTTIYGENNYKTCADDKCKTCGTDYKRETSEIVCKGNTDAVDKNKISARDNKSKSSAGDNKSKTFYGDNKNKTCADDKCKTCDTDYKRETSEIACKGKTGPYDNKRKISASDKKSKSSTDDNKSKTFYGDKNKTCADDKCKICDTDYKRETSEIVCKGKTDADDNKRKMSARDNKSKSSASDNKSKTFYGDKNKTCADDKCKTCDTDYKRETSEIACKGKTDPYDNKQKISASDNKSNSSADDKSKTFYGDKNKTCADDKCKTCDTDYKRETSEIACKGKTDPYDNKRKISASDNKSNSSAGDNISKTFYGDNKNKTCADDKCKTCDTDYKRETSATVCEGKRFANDNKSKSFQEDNKGKTFYGDKNKTCADEKCKTCDTDYKRETSATVCEGKRVANDKRSKSKTVDKKKKRCADDKCRTCETEYERETSISDNKSKISVTGSKKKIGSQNSSRTSKTQEKRGGCCGGAGSKGGCCSGDTVSCKTIAEEIKKDLVCKKNKESLQKKDVCCENKMDRSKMNQKDKNSKADADKLQKQMQEICQICNKEICADKDWLKQQSEALKAKFCCGFEHKNPCGLDKCDRSKGSMHSHHSRKDCCGDEGQYAKRHRTCDDCYGVEQSDTCRANRPDSCYTSGCKGGKKYICDRDNPCGQASCKNAPKISRSCADKKCAMQPPRVIPCSEKDCRKQVDDAPPPSLLPSFAEEPFETKPCGLYCKKSGQSEPEPMKSDSASISLKLPSVIERYDCSSGVCKPQHAWVDWPVKVGEFEVDYEYEAKHIVSFATFRGTYRHRACYNDVCEESRVHRWYHNKCFRYIYDRCEYYRKKRKAKKMKELRDKQYESGKPRKSKFDKERYKKLQERMYDDAISSDESSYSLDEWRKTERRSTWHRLKKKGPIAYIMRKCFINVLLDAINKRQRKKEKMLAQLRGSVVEEPEKERKKSVVRRRTTIIPKSVLKTRIFDLDDSERSSKTVSFEDEKLKAVKSDTTEDTMATCVERFEDLVECNMPTCEAECGQVYKQYMEEMEELKIIEGLKSTEGVKNMERLKSMEVIKNMEELKNMDELKTQPSERTYPLENKECTFQLETCDQEKCSAKMYDYSQQEQEAKQTKSANINTEGDEKLDEATSTAGVKTGGEKDKDDGVWALAYLKVGGGGNPEVLKIIYTSPNEPGKFFCKDNEVIFLKDKKKDCGLTYKCNNK